MNYMNAHEIAENLRNALQFAKAEYQSNPTPRWARQIEIRQARYDKVMRQLVAK